MRDLAYWLVANRIFEKPIVVFYTDRRGWTIRQYKEDTILQGGDRAIQKIRAGNLDPAVSVNSVINLMLGRRMSNNTINHTKYTVLGFLFYSRLGLDPNDMKRAVKYIPRVYPRIVRTPSRDEVKSILLSCDLKMKTCFSMLISTGARLGEILSVKKDQINFSKTPVELHLRANKVYRNRTVFLSSETVMFLKDYLKRRKNDYQYVFPGYVIRTRTRIEDKNLHMTKGTVGSYFKKIRRELHFNAKYSEHRHYYTPQIFRVLNLEILKSGGFPPEWAEYLIGHNIHFNASYLPPTASLAKAWIKHDHRFCFLTTHPPESPEEQVTSTPTREVPLISEKQSDQFERSPIGDRQRTTRWRTKRFDYLKTDIRSAGYDQAIADGFSLFDSSPNGTRVFRKRLQGGRQWLKSENRMLVPKREFHARPT